MPQGQTGHLIVVVLDRFHAATQRDRPCRPNAHFHEVFVALFISLVIRPRAVGTIDMKAGIAFQHRREIGERAHLEAFGA
jgi:hypothetical protein